MKNKTNIPMNEPVIVQNDPWLRPHTGKINYRVEKFRKKEESLVLQNGSLQNFASGYLYFGFHREENQWVFREWAPNATEIYLVGDFSDWQEQDNYKLKRIEGGNWEIVLPEHFFTHGDIYRLSVHWEGGKGDRLPAYARRVVQDKGTLIFSAQIWLPKEPYQWKVPVFRRKDEPPLIYEAHVGMAQEEGKVGSFTEFKEKILPEIIEAGYNTIQLMAIQEHPYYGSFGYHVSNYFAVSSRFGAPDELKALIDAAHEAGIAVIMDIVHSHAVKNEIEGLGKFDGSGYQYFHDGYRREHTAWDSLCFDYGKNEVLHFLLSNCRFWMEEYKFDGFRFDGVTSMIYLDHGLGRDFTSYDYYFDGEQDEDAITYLTLANKLIHDVNPKAITVAEEMSGMPGLAAPITSGGIGFNYRLAMGIPDYWIKCVKEQADEQWNVSRIYQELVSHRPDEKTISYAESHDQALVGDKTLIFWLIDKEMYWHMDKKSQNLTVDRGMALHKMIRLVTLATSGGGYLTFMGNEFGHPEWIDFPREGNNWSYQYARRQWSLKHNQELRYHYLGDFDKEMINLVNKEKILEQEWPNKILDHGGDQVLVFERGGLLFVFNFNPFHSFTDYGIPIYPGKFRIVLNTDSDEFGGQGLVDESMTYFAANTGKLASGNPYYLKLYLPSRTGLVLKRMPTKSVYE